jgi:hypothetical protein
MNRSQKKKILEVKALASELSRSRLLVSAMVRERHEELREGLLGLKKAEARLIALRGSFSFVGGAPPAFTSQIAELEAQVRARQESITDFKSSIADLEQRIENMSADCSQANQLLERLLAFTGGLDDFSGTNAAVIGGMALA